MIRKFSAFILIVFGAIALSGVAAHADGDPHKAPVWTCDTLQFDPVGPIDVDVHGTWDTSQDDIVGTYTPDADGVVTVPIGTLTHDRLITLTASLPGVYPGSWTKPVTLDCRIPTPPPTTPPTTQPPTAPPAAPPAPPAAPAELIATGPGTPGDLATTGAFTDTLSIAGALIVATGAFLIWATRKPKAA